MPVVAFVGSLLAALLGFHFLASVQSAAPQAPAYVPGPVWIEVPGLGPIPARDFDALMGGADV